MISTFILRATVTFFLGLGFAAGGIYLVNDPAAGVAPSQYPHLGWGVYPLAWVSAASVSWRILPGTQECEPKYGLFQPVIGLILSIIVFLLGLNILVSYLSPTMSSGGLSSLVWVISLSFCVILIFLSIDWFKRSLRGVKRWSEQRKANAG